MELSRHGFSVNFFGDTPVAGSRRWARMLLPVKALAARVGLITKSMKRKRLLKRLIFGRLMRMPAEIDCRTAEWTTPVPLAPGRQDRAHKVTFCAAELGGQTLSHLPLPGTQGG